MKGTNTKMLRIQKKINMLLMLFSLTFLIFALAGCADERAEKVRETRVITDMMGRKVTISENPERVVVGNRYNMEIIKALGVQDKVVGVDFGVYRDRETYGKLFNDKQIIGKNQRSLNYEKIIELNPEVLIIPNNSAWEEAEKKLEPFGIKVLILDPFYTDKFEEAYNLAGKIFHKEERAQEFIELFQKPLRYIDKQLKNVPKKTVYYEYRDMGKTTVPGDYFYQMLEYSHGENIFKDAHSVDIDVESVIQRNPEYIVKVGETGEAPHHHSTSEEEYMQRRKDIIERPGWDTISAVKNNRILLLSQYVQGAASKIMGSLYIAKFMYPENLPDLHPEDVFKTWVTEYQQMPYVTGHSYPAYSPGE